MKKIVFIGLFCLLMLPASAFGHKLIPTDGTNIDYESALEIPDPVISWAMYEELQDKINDVLTKRDALESFTPSLVLIGPETFLELITELRTLDYNTEFNFPLPDGHTAYVFDYNGSIPSKEFYEPFGQVTYWERQEIDLKIEAPGKYYMAVFDKNGTSGKLAVAIGYVEDFSGNDFVTVLPNAWLESRYFSEDYSQLFIMVGVLLGIFGLIGFGIYRKIKRK